MQGGASILSLNATQLLLQGSVAGIATMNDALRSNTNTQETHTPCNFRPCSTRASRLAASFVTATDLSSLEESFQSAVTALGFPHYAVSRLTRTRTRGSAQVQTRLELICAQYPKAWVRHYMRNDYAETDPVHRNAFARATPYRWEDIARLNPAERRILDEGKDAGLRAGLSIPIHQPDGSIVLCNLAGSAHTQDVVLEARTAYFISTFFHLQLQQLTLVRRRKSARYLSPRQIECLSWVAFGKTTEEISLIIERSRHTVNYHISEAMKNLNVHSRVAAAVEASSLGLLRR